MSSMSPRLLLPALLLVLPASAQAQAITPAESRQIDSVVGDALAKSGVPSASIAVVRGGQVVFAKAYGKQSETIREPRADAPYQIASISKQFTAAALLLLQDEGKLRLDDPVANYLPGITGGDRITIRQLLSHTSGLRDYWPQDFSFAAMAKPVTPQGILDCWAKAPLDFAPGTQWQYSNTGYVAAGMIVEKVAGEPLLAFLQRRIFQPLGITAYDQDKAVGPGFPQGYKRYALGPVRVETPAASGWLFAAGELAMSAGDLAKWDVARINRTVLPASAWRAQETSTLLANGTSTNYGLGVFVGSKDGRRFVEHSGEAVGFLSENIVYPDDKAAVVVLTNSWFGNVTGTIAQGITRVVLPPPATDVTQDALTTKARAVFDQLRAGTLDRALLTEDANQYFGTTALGDYRASLAPLGEPRKFEPVGRPQLRGGFVAQRFRVTYADQELTISTYAEPNGSGRFEQFLITPAS